MRALLQALALCACLTVGCSRPVRTVVVTVTVTVPVVTTVTVTPERAEPARPRLTAVEGAGATLVPTIDLAQLERCHRAQNALRTAQTNLDAYLQSNSQSAGGRDLYQSQLRSAIAAVQTACR